MTFALSAGIVFVLILHGFLAGLESALRSVDRLRLHHFADDGIACAVKVEKMLGDGISPLLSVETALAFMRAISFTVFIFVSADASSASLNLPLFFVLIMLFAVFSELLPRSLFISHPIDCLGCFDKAIRIICGIFGPVGRLFSLHHHFDGATVPVVDTPVVTRDTVHKLMRQGVSSGALTKRERDMIARVLSLQRRPVRSIMTPVRKMVSAPSNATLGDCFRISYESGFIRIPVRSPSEGEYVGVLNVFRMRGQTSDSSRKAAEFVKEPFTVSADISVIELLPMLRRNRQPLALVESAGKIVGLATLDDILTAVISGR